MTTRTSKGQPVPAQRGGVDLAWIDLPPHLDEESFDGDYAQTLRLTPTLALSIVPPRRMFGAESVDFSWAELPHSWVLLLGERLGSLRAEEIEFQPGSGRKLNLRVVRSSGRLVADGSATRSGDTFTFVLKIRCPPGTATIDGMLSRSGAWQFAVTAPRRRKPRP